MSKKKWEARITRIKEQYPEIGNTDWSEMFSNNPEVLYSMLGNVARSGITRKSKLSNGIGSQRLAALSSTDYSELQFSEALNALCTLHSVATLEIGEEELSDLRAGRTQPSIDQIEHIAMYFNRHPSYFMEYRIAYVLASINVFLTDNPQTSSSWFNKAYSRRALGDI